MIIAETGQFQLGPFTVLQRPRFDNPAFSVYIVFRAGQLIGKSFSRPDIGCCEWLENEHGRYAAAEQAKKRVYGYTAQTQSRQGRPTNAERARREAMLLTAIPAE